MTRTDWNASTMVDGNVEAGRGPKLAYVTDDASLTYEQLLGCLNNMGHALRELGVCREQRILLALDDSVMFPIAFLGALRIGAIPVPVATGSHIEDFRFYVGDADANVVVCDAGLVPAMETALSDREVRILARGGRGPKVVDLDGLFSAQPEELSAVACSRDDVAFWLYSSGSTGQPKGVIHRHGDLEVTCKTFGRQVLGICEDDRVFSTTKLYHAYGLGNSLSFPLYFGATAILLGGGREPDRLLRTLREQKPTVYCSVPSLYTLLAENGEADSAFDSVRLCVSAAEPLPTETFDRWLERFGLEIIDGIGSTELLHIYCANRPGRIVRGTMGRPVPGYKLRLTDDKGSVLRGPAIGALEVHGDSCTTGYWGRRGETERCIRDGWFVSGDRCERRADGTYVYLGRTDDMLKIAGLWISPVEMEHVLLAHPAVRAVGIVDTTIGGHRRIAALVERIDGPCDDQELADGLRAWCKERMRDQKFPHVVRFVDALPRTSTGKVQRFKLHEFLGGHGGPLQLLSDSEGTAHLGDLPQMAGGWRRGNDSGPLAERLVDLPEGAHAGVVEMVCSQVAHVLGLPTSQAVNVRRTFKEMGFDSISSVALCNRLSAATGLRVPGTAVFDFPSPAALATYLLQELVGGDEAALQKHHVLADARGVSRETIVIVGMSCRYPGGVHSPDELWQLVAAGDNGATRFPMDRGWETVTGRDPNQGGTEIRSALEGGFLSDVDMFDAAFFRISPREALAMDPQQRLVLEGAWEAFEDVGVDPTSLVGSQTSVFVGAMAQDYGPRMHELSEDVEGFRSDRDLRQCGCPAGSLTRLGLRGRR